MIVPSNHTTIGAFSPEHKERYDIIISEEWYIYVSGHTKKKQQKQSSTYASTFNMPASYQYLVGVGKRGAY